MRALAPAPLALARRACIGLVLAALALAAIAILNLILTDFRDSTLAVRGAMTGVIVLVTSLLLLANLAVLGRDGRHEAAWLAAGAAAAGTVLWLTATWRDWNPPTGFDWVWRSAICLYLVSLGSTITGQLMILSSRRVILNWVRWATAGALWLGFGLIILMVSGLLDVEDRFGRGPSVILTMLLVPINVTALLGVILVPMLIRMEERAGRGGPPESLDRHITLTLSCPRCGLEQSMEPGVRPCAGCRATLRIDIEEPRCECGYLLFKLTSPLCPECGRPVPQTRAACGNDGASTSGVA